MLTKQFQLIKTQQPSRPDYIQLPLFCPICKKINGHSRKYKSPYALMYHLTNFHNNQDEIVAAITIDEVRSIAKAITKACNWNMFLT